MMNVKAAQGLGWTSFHSSGDDRRTNSLGTFNPTDCVVWLDISVARELARRSVCRPRISDYSRWKEWRAFCRESPKHWGALASKSSPLVSGRLRNFYAGYFEKESQPARNLNYWALWAGYKF